MTTDSEAWVESWARFARAMEVRGHQGVASAAKDVVVWLRERQQRGDFGAPPERTPGCVCPDETLRQGQVWCGCPAAHPAPAPARLDAMVARSETYRLTVASANEAHERLRVMTRERDEQRARAEAAEATLREADALMGGGHRELTRENFCASISAILRRENTEEDAKLAAESLLKEALGALRQAMERIEPGFGATQVEAECNAVLSKARAAGYEP